jgi:(1->4)-alpha-D-glucan 1-alpha-D-glucosylmutase
MKEAFPFQTIPVSAYRLQFNRHFGFADAAKIVPHLHELGITDVYASPYFRARKGSLHGYDIVDPNTLNPEVGTEDEYDVFTKQLKKYGMGQILDIVPNHMSAGSENRWWMDVLENGRSSVYADFFDIDWNPVIKKLTGKILIPLLEEQYGIVLERQELALSFEEGAFFVSYAGNKFPLLPDTYIFILQHRIEDLQARCPAGSPHLTELLGIITELTHLPPHTEKDRDKISGRHCGKEIIRKRLSGLCKESPEIRDFIDRNIVIFNGIKGDPESFNLLDGLISKQVWRLARWRFAMEEINYRRFFDINNIVGLRIEDPAVFDKSHRLIFKLISERKVTGLRVDHPDGLHDPSEYFKRLQKECFIKGMTSLAGRGGDESLPEDPGIEPQIVRQFDDILSSDPGFRPFYVIAEKILTKDEQIPEDWPLFGTTGYDFLNSLNGIFVDAGNSKAFDRIYSGFIGAKTDFRDIVYEKKKLVMQVSMPGEISRLAHLLNTISEKDRHTRDFTLNSLTRAVSEVSACFPVYRTYVNALSVNDIDRRYIELAVAKAKLRNPAVSPSVFDFLGDVLMLRFPDDPGDGDKKEWLAFVMRFQQITGPLMAKGFEDTALYIFNRLVSLNEVGGSPERFGTPIGVFHGRNIKRAEYRPCDLSATSTHDTKRSEDVRARINVLSEVPGKWKEHLMRWHGLNKEKKAVVGGRAAPDNNEEYLLYQTLIGAWPIDPVSGPEYEVFKKRIREYMVKAMREAKVNTDWIDPDIVYENAVTAFIDAIMADDGDNRFLKDFGPFREMISHCGMFNSLSQTLLKIASPGVPDFYQGTETWDLSLVDPDNRRPVDYAAVTDMLSELKQRELEIGPQALAREVSAGWTDGRVKLYLSYKALNWRRENKLLFMAGAYIPLKSGGDHKEQVCSFARSSEQGTVLIIVPRFMAGLIQGLEEAPPGETIWDKTWIIIPDELAADNYCNIFTDADSTVIKQSGERRLYLGSVLSCFPAAMLRAK